MRHLSCIGGAGVKYLCNMIGRAGFCKQTIKTAEVVRFRKDLFRKDVILETSIDRSLE